MFDAITSFLRGKPVTPKYTVQKNPLTGRWEIYNATGNSVSDYSRRRDAIRGAERAGYELV